MQRLARELKAIFKGGELLFGMFRLRIFLYSIMDKDEDTCEIGHTTLRYVVWYKKNLLRQWKTHNNIIINISANF